MRRLTCRVLGVRCGLKVRSLPVLPTSFGLQLRLELLDSCPTTSITKCTRWFSGSKSIGDGGNRNSQQLLHTVDLLRRSMGLQTCALLWLDSTGDKLKFKELSSGSSHIAEGPLSAHTGVVAAIIKDRRPCLLESPRP